MGAEGIISLLLRNGHDYATILSSYSERRMMGQYFQCVMEQVRHEIKHYETIGMQVSDKERSNVTQHIRGLRKGFDEAKREALRLANRIPLYKAHLIQQDSNQQAFNELKRRKGGKTTVMNRAAAGEEVNGPVIEEALKPFHSPKTVPFSAQKRKAKQKR